MKALIIYFSFTSNVQTLAESLKAELERLGDVTLGRIEPQKERGYWGWLPRSFLPGWRVPIRQTITDLEPYDLVLLGFPKWTLSCPPVNQYVKCMNNYRGKKFALFMSYGGFDQERYLQSMVDGLAKRGADIVATLSIKRSWIREETYREALQHFCAQAATSVAAPWKSRDRHRNR